MNCRSFDTKSRTAPDGIPSEERELYFWSWFMDWK